MMFNMVTLDGFFAGPNGEIDWHTVDEAFDRFAVDQLDSAGGLLFGRVTYQMMASYWPTPEAIAADPRVADRMNALPKIVFSTTLAQAGWNNSRLEKEVDAAEISKLKQQPGKDLLVFGSADLAGTLIQLGLIDEIRMMVSPVVLGRGIPLFKSRRDPLQLIMLDTRTFPNGNVYLSYRPVQ